MMRDAKDAEGDNAEVEEETQQYTYICINDEECEKGAAEFKLADGKAILTCSATKLMTTAVGTIAAIFMAM